MNDERLTVSVIEAGRMLNCGRNLAYRLAREGKLPVLKLGRKMRVSLPALHKMLENVEGRGDENKQTEF